MRLRLLVALLLAAAGLIPAQARLGESLKTITARYGKPNSQPSKNQAMWLFEEGDGQVLYTVTFGDKGASIAEGFKPVRRAVLTKETAENFIHDQLSGRTNPDKSRVVKAGEAYAFGGKNLTCGKDEFVVVDADNDMLVIWSQAHPASILILTSEMVKRM